MAENSGASVTLTEEALEKLLARAIASRPASAHDPENLRRRGDKIRLGSWNGWAGIVLMLLFAGGGAWIRVSTQNAQFETRLSAVETHQALEDGRAKDADADRSAVQGVASQVKGLQESVDQLRDDVRELQKQLMQHGK